MSVPREKMTILQGIKQTAYGLVEGVARQELPRPDYKFQSVERAELDRESSVIDDKFGYASVTRSVNYSLDRRGVSLDSHSRDSLISNLKRADTLDEINDLHRAEMTHFMQSRNAQDNNYGSCLVGVVAHKTALTIWQINHGDKDIPEPPRF